MENKFYGLGIVLQVALLLIAFVNWITEMVVRWSTFVHNQSSVNLIMAILVTIFGAAYILEIIDIIWLCLKKKLFLAD